MKNYAKKLNTIDLSLQYGTVTEKSDRQIMVDTSSGVVEAKRAVNCVVDPEPGDLVMLSEDTFGRRYILSVLEREAGKNINLVFDENTDFKVKDGRLNVIAKEGINLASSNDVSILSRELNINAIKGNVSLHHLSFIGNYLDGQVEKIKLMATTCDSIVDRVSQTVKRSYRKVTEFEQLKAEMLDYVVDKVMSLRGKYSVLSAEEDVKIHGDKIFMG